MQTKKADYFVFTTVTSATGLPAWEPGPSKARSNSRYGRGTVVGGDGYGSWIWNGGTVGRVTVVGYGFEVR